MRNRIAGGVLLGGLYLIVEGGSSFFIVKILTSHLSIAGSGTWLIFLSFIPFVQMAHSCFGPVVVRELASLTATGRDRIEAYTATVNALFVATGLVLMIALTAIYFLYVVRVPAALGLWGVFSISMVIRYYTWKYLYIMNGLGYVGIDKLVNILGSLLALLATYVALLVRPSLDYLPVAMLLATATTALAASRACRKVCAGENVVVSRTADFGQLKSILGKSSPIFVMSLSGFVVMNSDVLIVERVVGIEAVASYAIISRIGLFIVATGALFSHMIFPFIAKATARGDYVSARKYYFSGVAVSVLFVILVACGAWTVYPELFKYFFHPQLEMDRVYLLLATIFALLCVHTIAHSNLALASGGITFGRLAAINAMSVILLSIPLAFMYGIKGLLIGNVIGAFASSILHARKSLRYILGLKLAHG